MKALLKLLSITLFAVTLNSQAEEITLAESFISKLEASYYSPQAPTHRAVLMLHQCNFDRSMYNEIGHELSLRGIHALSLEFRGFKILGHWPKDVQLAYDFLRNKIGSNGVIGVIGASCGGNQAKTLAKHNPINAMAFFSSDVVNEKSEGDIKHYKTSLAHKPTLFIAAEEDFTFVATKKGSELNKNINSLFLPYKGGKHGYPLLEQDKGLAEKMVHWFDNNLTIK